MADQPTTPSESRGEPDLDETPTSEAPASPPLAADAPIPAGEPFGTPVSGPVTTAPPEDPAAAERRAQLRRRAILAGAATALALGGGLTGFVIGHSTADDSTPGFRPANFSQQGPGQQFGEGRQGPPSFGDRDGDHGFGQPPQDFGNGSSSGSSSGTGTPGT